MPLVSLLKLTSWLLVPFFLFQVRAAPVANLTQPDSRVIPDHYIFVMKSDLSHDDWEAHKNWSSSLAGQKKWVYNNEEFRGYCGNFSVEAVQKISESDAVRLAADNKIWFKHMDADLPQVAYVKPDQYVKASTMVAQANATWGLNRISQRKPEGVDDNVYTFDISAGAGTFSYVLDSGIKLNHVEFGGRASFGASFANDGSNEDLNGHGTHVAGTIGSITYGVAKSTQLIAVKVLNKDGVGGMGDVLAGLSWAVQDMKSNNRTGNSFANLSLDGPFDQATNEAVAAAVQAGLFVGVAAGNDAVSNKLVMNAS